MLYPSLLRNLLMRLATADLCTLYWSDEVQMEWQRNVAGKVGASPSALRRTQTLMEEALPAARVSDYEHRIAALHLPDLDDRHVLAATLEAGAAQILTFNLRDFPSDLLTSLQVEAVHPDQWLCGLCREFPDEFSQVVWTLLDTLKNPTMTLSQFIDKLRGLQLHSLADMLASTKRTL